MIVHTECTTPLVASPIVTYQCHHQSLGIIVTVTASRNAGESSGFAMRPSLPTELLQRAAEPFRSDLSGHAA